MLAYSVFTMDLEHCPCKWWKMTNLMTATIETLSSA